MVTRTSRILGADGQPIQLGDLAEPQTSHIGNLHREFQGHPARGLTPSKLASLLLAAEQGDIIGQYELFEDMEERDAHILSEMSKRRRAVSGLAWTIVPPNNPTAQEKAAAERLEELLQEVDDFESVLFDATDGIGKGFSCQEIEWQRVDRTIWLPKTITHRPQSWFRLHRGFSQEIRLRDASADGAPLTPFGWITHTHRARSGYLERAALFRALVWPYLFKNYSVGDLAEFLEIYGIPLRVGKYPPGAGDKEKNTLLRALINIGHNAAGIIPEGMALEFHETADGDAKAFQLMIEWCERSVSKAILGGTLTSQADGKSSTNALGNVHNEVRKELKDSDAKQIAATLSRELVYPIAALNGLVTGGFRRCPRFRFDIAENKDIKVFADSLPALVEMGMRVPRKWAHEELGIPEAEDDEDVLQPRPQPAPIAPPGAPGAKAGDAELELPAAPPTPAEPPVAKAAATAQHRHAEDDIPSRAAQLLGKHANPHIVAWVDRLAEALDRHGSLAAFSAHLDREFEDLPTEQLSDLMAKALLVSELGGRATVQDEVDAERDAT